MWANIASLTSEKVPLTMLLKTRTHMRRTPRGFTPSSHPHFTHREETSFGAILGTEVDPTQMMDSREQLHVDGHRDAFFGWPGWDRRHRDTERSAQMRRAGGMLASWTRMWEEGGGREGRQRAPLGPLCAVKCCTDSLTSAERASLFMKPELRGEPERLTPTSL